MPLIEFLIKIPATQNWNQKERSKIKYYHLENLYIAADRNCDELN